jgi:23S rRNA (cytosine1962-C5)-methyltransferase
MDYQLLDFGRGRRLEAFGGFRLDRPCPAVERVEKAQPKDWDYAHACFEDSGAKGGRWFFPRKTLPDSWTVAWNSLRFELKCTPQGQVGVFPEQVENWEWIAREGGRGKGDGGDNQRERLSVLNLFAYTGGSTLAAAAAGMEVTHVDAAQNIVDWARRNAELSGLADAPIRWICEDAWKFVKREFKRGKRYDAVILDPPSYGHGPKGEVWQLAKHLPLLLAQCAELVAGQCRFVLLTCHTPGYDAPRLSDMLKAPFNVDSERSITAKPLSIRAADGRKMPSGAVVRWNM